MLFQRILQKHDSDFSTAGRKSGLCGSRVLLSFLGQGRRGMPTRSKRSRAPTIPSRAMALPIAWSSPK